MRKAAAKLREHPLVKRVDSLIRQWDGELTQDLVLHPGEFGLGKVPARLKPDDTTDMVCGFCSTGCSLRIHLKDGQAINLSPTTNYPVNLGMACPKGWEGFHHCQRKIAPSRRISAIIRSASTDRLGHRAPNLYSALQSHSG